MRHGFPYAGRSIDTGEVREEVERYYISYLHVIVAALANRLGLVYLFCRNRKLDCYMRPKLLVIACVGSCIFAIIACNKETSPPKKAAFDFELLKGGTWIDYQSNSSLSAMKFRFYGEDRVTYSFRTAVYPSLKYDSFPNGKWEFIYPDTLRLYDHSWNCYGYIQVLNLTNTELHSRMPGYADVLVLKKEPN